MPFLLYKNKEETQLMECKLIDKQMTAYLFFLLIIKLTKQIRRLYLYEIHIFMETTPSSKALAEQHDHMKVKEVAEYLRIPVPTIYYLVQRGILPGAIQIGGRWRIKRSVINRDVLKNEVLHPLAVCLQIRDNVLEKLVR